MQGRPVRYLLADQGVPLLGGRLRLRQVTRLSGEHQTPIVTSRRDLPALEVAYRMFERWRQENFFKYLREEHALDALWEYAVEPDDPVRDVPNPEWPAAHARLRAARKVPGILYTGPKDQHGQGYPAAFAASRTKGALWALIVQPEMGHSVGDCPALLYPFYRDIIRAWLVEDTEGRVTLRDMDPGSGWLGDAKTFAVAPAKESKSDPASASWLSRPYVATLWRLLNTQPSGRLGIADVQTAIEAR